MGRDFRRRDGRATSPTRADLVAIVPATADVLARLAQGRSDDLVAAVALSARGPVLAAPAMHPRMWSHPATRRNVAELAAQQRVSLVGPVSGEVASGAVGMGGMAEPAEIFAAIASRLSSGGDLAGLRVVVTAGPTLEDIDPVRFIGNRSTGKMGFALAERAAARGAAVTLVAGPVGRRPRPPPPERSLRRASTCGDALEDAGSPPWPTMGQRPLRERTRWSWRAAVADHRPAETSGTKVKKEEQGASMALVKNPDHLAEVGAARTGRRPVLVGFAVETSGGEALIAYARRKLTEKRVDLVVANQASDSFGRDDNRAVLVGPAAADDVPTTSKQALADVIFDRIRSLLAPVPPGP